MYGTVPMGRGFGTETRWNVGAGNAGVSTEVLGWSFWAAGLVARVRW